MKKLFFGACALTIFSLAIILFQISCQKSGHAESGTEIKTSDSYLNLILFTRSVDSGDFHIQNEYWTIKTDGTEAKKIPITLPEGWYLNEDARLTADGKSIIFSVYDNPYPTTSALYKCSIDGSSLVKLADATDKKLIKVDGAY